MDLLVNWRTHITGTVMALLGLAGAMDFISLEMVTKLGVALTGLIGIFICLGVKNEVAKVAAQVVRVEDKVADVKAEVAALPVVPIAAIPPEHLPRHRGR